MRPKNPTNGVRPRDQPDKDTFLDKPLTLKSYVWQKDRKALNTAAAAGVLKDLDWQKSIAKDRHAKVVEAEESKVTLDERRKKQQERIAGEKRYDAIMQDALDTLVKDDSERKQLMD